MKIGIFGGAFNPPHIGHIAIARAALDAGLDHVVFMVSGRAPHKEYDTALAEHRYNMTRLAIAGEWGMSVSRYELDRDEISYSADTIEFLNKNIDAELYFLIGDDSYRDFYKWYQPLRIFENATVMVFPRLGVEVKPPAIPILMEKVEISSSELREKIKSGENVKNLLPNLVREYIIDNNMYR